MKKQVIVINGGDTFEEYSQYLEFLKNFVIDLEYYRTSAKRWKSKLAERLGESYDVIQPEMPNKLNARYAEWKLWFEKILKLVNQDLILIGHSLGGSFLAKYLAENNSGKKINGLFLVSACFKNSDIGPLPPDFAMPDKLNKVEQQVAEIFLYHSKDDEVVPFSDLELFKNQFPNAVVRVFENRGHFNQEEFPEIIEDIKSLE